MSDTTVLDSGADDVGADAQLMLLIVDWGGFVMALLVTLYYSDKIFTTWTKALRSQPAPSDSLLVGSQFSDGEEDTPSASPFNAVIIFGMEENKKQGDLTMWAFAKLFRIPVRYATMLPGWKCDTAMPAALAEVARIFFSGGYAKEPHLTPLKVVRYTAPKRPGVRQATVHDWRDVTNWDYVADPHWATQSTTTWSGMYVVVSGEDKFVVAPVRYFGCARHKNILETTRNAGFTNDF